MCWFQKAELLKFSHKLKFKIKENYIANLAKSEKLKNGKTFKSVSCILLNLCLRSESLIDRIVVSNRMTPKEIGSWIKTPKLVWTTRRAIKKSGIFKYTKPCLCQHLTSDHEKSTFSLHRNIWSNKGIGIKTIFSYENKFNFNVPNSIHSYWHELKKGKRHTFHTWTI